MKRKEKKKNQARKHFNDSIFLKEKAFRKQSSSQTTPGSMY